MDHLKPVPLVFWRSASGHEPVREWLNELSHDETSGTNWRLTVSDNGVGRPHDGAGSGDGLGSTLVKALAQQVKAQIETVSSAHELTVSITHATFTSGPA